MHLHRREDREELGEMESGNIGARKTDVGRRMRERDRRREDHQG
jgi:hypothetical protein